MPRGFLYLLHFHVARFHAKHYLGSSVQLIQRLSAHADGQAACLTRALWEDGDDWTLAALFVPRHTTPLTERQLEAAAKKRHSSPDYCPICNPKTFVAPKGCIEYPTFPITASQLRNLSNVESLFHRP